MKRKFHEKCWKFLVKIAFLVLLIAGIFSGLGKATAQVSQVPVSGPTIYTPRFYSPDQSNIYFDGQPITIHTNYGHIGLKVTADLSIVDKNWSSQMSVTDNNSGTYTLVTPALLGETMKIGKIAIPFTAMDEQGDVATVASTHVIETRTYPIKGGASYDFPARLTALAGDGQITLWWTQIPEAPTILVRYQDDMGLYRQVIVPSSEGSVVFKNLKNGFQYTFMVAGRHESGTVGAVKTILVAPNGPVTASAQAIVGEATQEPAKTVAPAIGGGESTVREPASVAQNPQTSEKTEEKPKSEEVAKLDNTTSPEQKNNWNRWLLAISILIIAIGAAIGGYYGYEWWMAKKEEPLKPSGPKSKSRW